jgi:glycosyltransferase involved in cell wall biosynthesis
MSAYNEERFIASAVESILGQTYGDLELIVVNDGSTDGTRDILARYEADDRLRVIDQTNSGYVAAWRCAISHSTGEILARMDADDISDKERFSSQLEYLDKRPDAGLVCCGYRRIDERGKVMATSSPITSDIGLRLGLLYGPSMAHGTVMMRREVFEAVGGYRSDYWPTEDYDLWVRLAISGCGLGGIADPLYSYRVHSRSTSSQAMSRQAQVHRSVQQIAQSSALADVLKMHSGLLRDIRSQSSASSPHARSALTREVKLVLRTGLNGMRSGPDRISGWRLSLAATRGAPTISARILFDSLLEAISHRDRVRPPN